MHGTRSGHPVAHPVRVRHQLPHHLPGLHDRAGGVAGDDRRHAAFHRQPALPAHLRLLAQGLRGVVRHGRGDGDRHGLPVRHQLGRAGRADRARSRGRSSDTRPSPPSCSRRPSSASCCSGATGCRPAFYFFACCMVSLGTMFSSFWILANNSLDAGPGRPRDRRRQDHSRGLARDRARAGDDGALAAHAAGRVPDHRNVHRGRRRVVHAARGPPSGGAGHAALGPRAGGGADPGAVVLRPPHGPLRASAPAGEVRGDRGALAKPATGLGGADRLARRGERAQPLRA